MTVDISSEAVERKLRALFSSPKGVEEFVDVQELVYAQAERIKTLESAAMDRLVAEGQRCDAMTPQCIHMTAEMAANCPTCNPSALRGLPTLTPQEAAKVKPLDLSNALKHAFIEGRCSVSGSSSHHTEAWCEYDPTGNAAYQRIARAISEDSHE